MKAGGDRWFGVEDRSVRASGEDLPVGIDVFESGYTNGFEAILPSV